MDRKERKDEAAPRSRSSKPESKSENPTLRRLAGTPFKTAAEMNEAEAKIYKESWDELTKARSYQHLTDKEEFAFFKRVFEKGMRCRYGEGNEDIVRVGLSGGEVIVEINEEMKSREHSEKLVSSLAQALGDSFFTNYLKAMRILPADGTDKGKNSSPASNQAPSK
jgi:hypothetical protein